MSFRKKLFKNIIILGGYSYFTQILSFLSSIVLSRLLVPSEYGLIALIAVFTGFIGQFSDAGLSYIIIRSDYKELFYSTIHYLAVIIGVVLTIIVIALAYPIAIFYKNPLLVLAYHCDVIELYSSVAHHSSLWDTFQTTEIQ